MPYIKNQDVKIYYQVEGAGPPLVLLSGLTRTIESWKDFGYVEQLKNKHQLILIERRGMGRSDLLQEPVQYSFKSFCKDIIAVLDHLDLNRCHCMGYSFGGWLVYGLARLSPGRVQSMILLDGFPGPDDPSYLQSSMDKRTHLSEDERQALMAVATWMAADIRDIIDQIDEVIGEIKVPTLLLTSDLPEDSQEFRLAAKSAAIIPGTSLITFGGINHKELFNRSAEVLPHILKFLAEVR
jgi:pimeloyl-ACP methyl ester carboxylesterase